MNMNEKMKSGFLRLLFQENFASPCIAIKSASKLSNPFWHYECLWSWFDCHNRLYDVPGHLLNFSTVPLLGGDLLKKDNALPVINKATGQDYVPNYTVKSYVLKADQLLCSVIYFLNPGHVIRG